MKSAKKCLVYVCETITCANKNDDSQINQCIAMLRAFCDTDAPILQFNGFWENQGSSGLHEAHQSRKLLLGDNNYQYKTLLFYFTDNLAKLCVCLSVCC